MEKTRALAIPPALIIDMNNNLPDDLTMRKIQERIEGRNFRLPIRMGTKLMESEISELELSVRSSNVLYRTNIFTVGDLVNNINGFEDLKKIRNCGNRSASEIMVKLFCFQYMILEPEKRKGYLNRVLEVNGIG